MKDVSTDFYFTVHFPSKSFISWSVNQVLHYKFGQTKKQKHFLILELKVTSNFIHYNPNHDQEVIEDIIEGGGLALWGAGWAWPTRSQS